MLGVVLLVDFQVHDPEGFAEAVQRLTRISLAEPGTLRYEWFVSDDGTAARIIEEFADEAALAEHSVNIRDAVAPLLAASQIVRTSVLGEVSDERREHMTGPHTDFMGGYAGFRR
jgi:quinol monooxygenase YgiN